MAIYNLVSIHQRYLQLLMIETYKTEDNLNPSDMENFFVEKTNTYNLRNNDGLLVPRPYTTVHGIETIRFSLETWKCLRNA